MNNIDTPITEIVYCDFVIVLTFFARDDVIDAHITAYRKSHWEGRRSSHGILPVIEKVARVFSENNGGRKLVYETSVMDALENVMVFLDEKMAEDQHKDDKQKRMTECVNSVVAIFKKGAVGKNGTARQEKKQ